MVKPSARTFLSFTVFAVLYLGCGSVPPRSSAAEAAPPRRTLADHPMLATPATTPLQIRKLWTQQVPGLMTDLAVSRDGSAVILATVPNPDVVDGPRETGRGLSRFDRSGKKLWHIQLEATVKSLTLSDDGKLAYVSTYDNAVLAIDKKGKTVWSIDGLCKPYAVGKHMLCYHDDDAEPRVAFDVYTDRGRKRLFYPITHDVLALKIADNGKSTAIALEGGQLSLFGPDFRTLWQRKVSGEVLDIAVSSGEHPRVWALFNNSGAGKNTYPGQSVVVFDEDGKLLAEGKPSSRVEQLEAAPSGEGVAGYGNGALGQFIAFYEYSRGAGKAPASIVEKWYRNDRRAADFSSSMIAARDSVIFGFEDVSGGDRRSHLISYDFDGGLKWDLPLVTEDGAYLYAHGFAPLASVIVVGTDDGYLNAFQLKK